MKEKTNNFIAIVQEELEKYQDQLKEAAVEDLELYLKKQEELEKKEDDDNESEEPAELDADE